MSGGHYDYVYCKIDEASYLVDDKEISDLLRDLAKL